MKAMIFAAGLGTRLQPYTNTMPKAMVPVKGVPMLGRLIQKLKSAGFNQIVINVHHFADQITGYLRDNNNFGLQMAISDESHELLDTGGGLIHAKAFLDGDEPFLLHNVDIYSEIDLNAMMHFHRNHNALVSLAVCHRDSSNYLLFDNNNRLCGWKSLKTKQEIIALKLDSYNEMAFSGIHVIEPEIFRLIDRTGKFGIIPEYLRLAAEHKLMAYIHDGKKIKDLGKPEAIIEIEKSITEA